MATLSSSLATAILSRGLGIRHHKDIPCLVPSSLAGQGLRSMASRSQSTLRRSGPSGNLEADEVSLGVL